MNFTLSEYSALLELALDSGYSFSGYSAIEKDGASLDCILRHDIDSELYGCDAILDIENRLNIKATYFVMLRSTAYNLFSVESLEMIEKIVKAGHNLGLHFMGELVEDLPIDKTIEKVQQEILSIESEFGVRVPAVSFHQPSKKIIESQILIPGVVNTYNKKQMGEYFYISDTNMTWRHESPKDVFENTLYRKLQLLIHPIWWTSEKLPTVKKWTSIINLNNKVLLSHWQARENSIKDLDLKDEFYKELVKGSINSD